MTERYEPDRCRRQRPAPCSPTIPPRLRSPSRP